MQTYLKRSVALVFALACASFSSAAGAASLISATDEAQLAAWLGEGQIKLTNIYTKVSGDTSANFHAAVDGKGRTFAVMQAYNSEGESWLVGGYDPQSWSTKGGFNMTAAQSDRTGFLFNLTSGTKHLQAPKTPALDSVGSYQTWNHINSGPTFGIGNDLAVDQDMTHGLSLMYSYMDESGSNFYRSLLDNSVYTAPNVTFGAIEIYTISAVPEPSAAMLLLAGAAALALVRRRRHR